MAYGAPAPASMGMFKCKDCGSPVDDPTQHICRRGPGAQPSSAASRGGNGGRYDDPYDSRQPYSPPRSPYATADDRYYDGDDRRDDRRGYDDGRGGAGNGGGRSPAPRAPPSPAPDTAADNGGAAAAPKKGFGLDFLSAGYTKLFGGAAGTGGGATSPAPEQQQQQNGGGGEYDDVDRLAGKFSDSRLDDRVDDRYDDTALPPPAQGGNGNGGRAEIHTMHSYGSSGMPPSPAPYGGAAGEDPDSIELSEIMLFKDDKQVVCGGCKGLVWKGEEIVCIGADVVHATCCVCQDCGLSADRDPYGSDGWRQVAGMVVCADCLARDAQENGGASTVSAAPDKGAVVPAQQQQQQQQQRYQDDDDQDRYTDYGPPAVSCGTCRLPITHDSEAVTHAKLQGVHHARCLDCQHCRRSLDETFSTTNPVHMRQGRPLCHPCYLATLPRCGGCDKVITRDTRVCAALGRKYHPACFCCARCGTGFPDKSFYVLKDKPYCRWCYHEENGSICGGCRQPIEGPCACVVEGRFHPKCFVCTTCGDPLNDIYYAFEGRPFCEVHILELQRKRGGGKDARIERRQTLWKNV